MDGLARTSAPLRLEARQILDELTSPEAQESLREVLGLLYELPGVVVDSTAALEGGAARRDEVDELLVLASTLSSPARLAALSRVARGLELLGEAVSRGALDQELHPLGRSAALPPNGPFAAPEERAEATARLRPSPSLPHRPRASLFRR